MADTKKIKIAKKDKDMNALSPAANTALNILLIVAVIITVIPLWVIVVASFTSEQALGTYGYGFWPQEWSIKAYTFLFNKGSIIGIAYKTYLEIIEDAPRWYKVKFINENGDEIIGWISKISVEIGQ